MSRDPFSAPHVESRRGGPAKKPLSRDAIVEEALRQIKADGLQNMSLRKVALALDTGPASLYAYVEDLRELHALVLDRALGSVALGRNKGPWRQRLGDLLKSYLGVLCASPGLAQLAFGTVAVGPNALRIADTLLGLLREAGVEEPTAAWAIDLLTLYVTAIAAEQAGGLEPVGAVQRALRGVTQAEHPHLHAASAHLASGTGEERFEWAIEVLLQGIVRSRRAPGRTARSSPARQPRERGR